MKTKEKIKIPYFKQETEETCGAAVLRMVLSAFGHQFTEKELAEKFITLCDGSERHEEFPSHSAKNSYFPMIAESLKLDYVVGRNSSLSNIQLLTDQGYIVIVCYFYEAEGTGHYAVVSSINETTITLLDPHAGPETKYNLEYFSKFWFTDPKDDNEKSWFVAIKSSLPVE